ncbi:beta-lactamase-like protein [Mycena polygramma]|nr:beta-lactamase-like protein [Mycena polygramma]
MVFFPSLFLGFLVGGSSASYLDLGLPRSTATVSVKVFNVGNTTLVNEAHGFVAPVLPGHESINVPMFAFLVEHEGSQKRVMFDLGIRNDTENFAPSVEGFFTSGVAQVSPHKGIHELLQDGGISLASIDAVIWSHSHFDHIGDMSKFPNTTGIIIGSETDTETYPQSPNATLQDSDFAGHQVTKIDFAAANLTFSGLKAIDYFGDGSFYLLNTPGHMLGHLTALARVTPTTFIALGGDTFHNAGEARPRPQFQKNFPCPAHLLEETKSSISTDYFWSPHSHDGAFDMLSRAQQLLAVSDLPDSFYADPIASQISLEKVATFDADPDIFVVIAHDISLRDHIPYFPESLNNWKATHLKEKTVWNFVNKTNPAFVFSPANQTA